MATFEGFDEHGIAVFKIVLPIDLNAAAACPPRYVDDVNRRYGTALSELSDAQFGRLMDVHDFARAAAEREWPKVYSKAAKGVARALAAAILDCPELAADIERQMRRRFQSNANHLSSRTVKRMPAYDASRDAIEEAGRAAAVVGLI